MKLSYAALAACCILFCGAPHHLHAGNPAAQPSPPRVIPDATVTIDLGANRSVSASCYKGSFETIGLQPNQVVSIDVQLPAALAGHQIAVDSLDGGLASSVASTVAADGTLSLQFQAGSQPGVYRMRLRDGPRALGFEFWVLDRTNPRNNPYVINPTD